MTSAYPSDGDGHVLQDRGGVVLQAHVVLYPLPRQEARLGEGQVHVHGASVTAARACRAFLPHIKGHLHTEITSN